MIVTVTMNPAIDKTAELDSFEHGGLNRLSNVILDAGGKGINVSKTIKALGGESIASGFIGGSEGILIERTLEDIGIQHDFVNVKDKTRTNLKVVEKNGPVTELNEPGPLISQVELIQLENKLISYANKDTLFIFAGSIPNGVDTSIYKSLTEKLKEKEAKVFLDADGELFVHSLEAKPNIIKPNRHEIEKYFDLDHEADETELIGLGEKLLDMGIEFVAISLGSMGALFITKDKKIKCPGLKVKAHSTVGAGDAMVAALSFGLDSGLSLEDSVKLSMATSAGAVTTQGTKPPTRELVNKLLEKVELIYL